MRWYDWQFIDWQAEKSAAPPFLGWCASRHLFCEAKVKSAGVRLR